jgi:hypothetical protein
MRVKMIATFEFNYFYEDFAETGQFNHIAYYKEDENGYSELVVVKEELDDSDFYDLWVYLGEETGGWDGELTGYKMEINRF